MGNDIKKQYRLGVFGVDVNNVMRKAKRIMLRFIVMGLFSKLYPTGI